MKGAPIYDVTNGATTLELWHCPHDKQCVLLVTYNKHDSVRIHLSCGSQHDLISKLQHLHLAAHLAPEKTP